MIVVLTIKIIAPVRLLHFLKFIYHCIYHLPHPLHFTELDCRVGHWGKWGKCSHECGVGVAERFRSKKISRFPNL